MKTSPYTPMIRRTLAERGLIGTDPILVEVWMRLEFGTLDALSPARFAIEVEAAAACVHADPETSRRLAATY